MSIFESNLKGKYNDIVYDSKNISWSGGLNNYLNIFSGIDWQTSVRYRAPQKTAVSKEDPQYIQTLHLVKIY